MDLLAPEVITEASPTMDITWTEGTIFGIWQTDVKYLMCIEAAVAGLTTGKIEPYMLIEIDSGGKW